MFQLFYCFFFLNCILLLYVTISDVRLSHLIKVYVIIGPGSDSVWWNECYCYCQVVNILNDTHICDEWPLNVSVECICCNAIDQGETPLHVACRHGLVNLVRALLEAGSNANMQTVQPADEDHSMTKQTPLHIAVEAGHKDIVKVFLDFKGVCIHTHTHTRRLKRICKAQKSKKSHYAPPPNDID